MNQKHSRRNHVKRASLYWCAAAALFSAATLSPLINGLGSGLPGMLLRAAMLCGFIYYLVIGGLYVVFVIWPSVPRFIYQTAYEERGLKGRDV